MNIIRSIESLDPIRIQHEIHQVLEDLSENVCECLDDLLMDKIDIPKREVCFHIQKYHIMIETGLERLKTLQWWEHAFRIGKQLREIVIQGAVTQYMNAEKRYDDLLFLETLIILAFMRIIVQVLPHRYTQVCLNNILHLALIIRCLAKLHL